MIDLPSISIELCMLVPSLAWVKLLPWHQSPFRSRLIPSYMFSSRLALTSKQKQEDTKINLPTNKHDQYPALSHILDELVGNTL